MDEFHELQSAIQEIKPLRVKKRETLKGTENQPQEKVENREPLKETTNKIRGKAEFPKHLREGFSVLKPSKNRLLIRRQAILDAYSPGMDNNLATNEKRLARGGHILADHKLIDDISNETDELFKQWAEAFEKIYEVKYQKVDDDITEAPKAVVGAYDLRIDTWMLDVWQEAEMLERKLVREKCTQIIERWERWLTIGERGNEPDFGEDLPWITGQRLRR